MAIKKQSLFDTPPGGATEFLQRTLDESDRGCVLLTMSRFDELLQDLHKTYIKSIAPVSGAFLDKMFDNHAPLSTISAKISVALGYGLITQLDYQDLELIRKLRNSAAHTTQDFAFALPDIKAIVGKLTSPKRVPKQFPSMLLSPEERQALADPLSTPQMTKQYFVLAAICLNAVILDKIGAIMHKDWEAMKKKVPKAVEPEPGC